eukprot:991056_1
MYATKRIHDKTDVGYISVGDPYNDRSRPQKDPRRSGRQFSTRPPAKNRIYGYFGQLQHPDGEPFSDVRGYLKSQPRDVRTLGFGSNDASKRDEFTVSFRAHQWKEVLDREIETHRVYSTRDVKEEDKETPSRLQKRLKRSKRESRKKKKTTRKYFQCRVPELLFEIGRTDEGTTPSCTRCSRDTFFCKHRVANSARVGQNRSTSSEVGSLVVTQASDLTSRKPQWGRRSLIRDFYDTNHLHCVGY